MNLTQFIASLQLIIAHLYDNIDSLKKKNDNLESLVIIQKKQIQQLYDDNEHHKIESIFKAFARAIRKAVKRDSNYMVLPSTKGTL